MRQMVKSSKLQKRIPDAIKRVMIAPCGMNCALCIGYLREKNQCGGCVTMDENTPNSCRKCIIRNCDKLKEAKRPYCFECDTFPCKRLKGLDKRYRTKYGMSMLDNLGYIRNAGIRKFLQKEKERWTCRQCGGIISVHRRECLYCGAEKSPAQLNYGSL